MSEVPTADVRAGVLLRALRHDPVTCWVTASPSRYEHAYGMWLDAMVKHADSDEHGMVATDTDGGAENPTVVQLWYTVPAKHGPIVLNEHQSAQVLAAFGPDADRFAQLLERMDAAHPVGQAHVYLPLIGAEPAQRRRGYGTTALTRMLQQLDRAALPAYLEASSSQSRRLYQRLGFYDCGTELVLPNGPRLYPMWRWPQ